MKLNLLHENEFDSPELIQWKVHRSAELAREMEGWDINVTTVEMNRYADLGNEATIAARFFDKEQAKEWMLKSDADKREIQKWFDERFEMPCFLAFITFNYPEE